MADDKLAAELAEIAARARQVLARRGLVGGLLAINAARDDVPRLVKAVEAALALVAEWEGKAVVMRAALRREAAHGQGIRADLGMVAAGRQTAADELREAIARELTGKDNADA